MTLNTLLIHVAQVPNFKDGIVYNYQKMFSIVKVFLKNINRALGSIFKKCGNKKNTIALNHVGKLDSSNYKLKASYYL